MIYHYQPIRYITNQLFLWGMVKTATGQNGDKPKRLHVQSKRIKFAFVNCGSFLVNF